MKKPRTSKTVAPENFDSPNSRENYLYFADCDYLGARALFLLGLHIPAGVLAEQAVEKYMKLKLIEFTDGRLREETFTRCGHNLICLFPLVSAGMKKNNLKLGSEQYYEDLLQHLTNCFKWKYFDKRGFRGELSAKGQATTGMSDVFLPKFDQLCMELRNAVFLLGLGASPVSKAMNTVKPWGRKEYANLAWAFYTNNEFAKQFVERSITEY